LKVSAGNYFRSPENGEWRTTSTHCRSAENRIPSARPRRNL